MRLALVLALALALSGCAFSLSGAFPPGPVPPPPPPMTRSEEERATFVQVMQDQCFARAAKFRGLVATPCEDIARRIAP